MASISAQNGVIHHGSKVSEEKDHDKDNDPLPADAAKGLMSSRAILFLILWYIFSLLTLFLNRIILTSLGGDPVVLSTFQMVGTTALGLAQMYYPCGMFKNVKREGARPKNFYRNMIIVGTCRFFTVFLGLLALEYVEVSFTETVKSSAPIFTVLIAKVLTGEVTGLFTQLSLIPIMSGLALCSAFELSFNFSGFIAALGTNLTECLQNVYSKMLICGTSRYTPAEMQYYTSVASILIQIPFCIFFLDYTKVVNNFSTQLLVAYLANGIFFHYQTICAYVLMGYISPVTHSVANTVKRALLIWLSILFFGNTVTFLSGFGTMIVFIGVLLYNKARDVDHKRLTLAIMYSDAKVNNV